MIKTKINKDIAEEFISLKQELKIHITDNSDIKIKKDFLAKHIPNEIIYKTNLLLDTLLIYLEEQSINMIKDENVKIRNNFFRLEIKKKIKTKVLTNNIFKDTDKIDFSSDPVIKNEIIAGSIPLLIGTSIIIFIFPKLSIASILTGITSIALSGGVFKFTSNKSKEQAEKKMKLDIEKYLSNTENIVTERFENIIEVYNTEFQQFCKKHNLKIKESNE